MVNRQINVLKADGSWGPAGVNIDAVDSHDYLTEVPKSKSEEKEIRRLIAEDFGEDKPAKEAASKRKRKFSVSFSAISPFQSKELIYRHRKASDLKVFSDGTWDYSAVESEDKNDKYLVE